MIRLVTDSTAAIPADLLDNFGISVVPLKVQLGQQTFDETSGISSRDIFRWVAATNQIPATSQPAAGEFKQTYQTLIRQNPDADILVITVSSKLSGACNTAKTAAGQLPQAKITVFDSLSAGLGTGLMVITAAEMAVRGHTLPRIMARLAQMRRATAIGLVVNNLNYLKQGGRIGAASAFLGTLLNTKPVLAIHAGRIEPVARVRTTKKALNRLLAYLDSTLPAPTHPVQAGVMHAGNRASAAFLANRLRARFNVTRLFVLEFSPVLAVHVGPGAIGAGLCPEPK